MRHLSVLTAMLATMATPALAVDGSVAGKIASIDVAEAENYGFRVTLEGAPVMCGAGTAQWAYINKSFSNYEAMASAFMSAWLAGKPVTVHSNKAGYNGTFCQIVYMQAR